MKKNSPFLFSHLHSGVGSYRSSRLTALRVPHAFSKRVGGFDFAAGRSVEPLIEAMGAAGRSVAQVRQVHGAAVRAVTRANAAELADADAIITADVGVVVMVRVADCVPVLLAEADEAGAVRCVAAIHAGWRGLVAGVIPAAIAALVAQFGASPHRLVAAIGPCISGERYEVGPEVAEQFEQAGLAEAVMAPIAGGKPHVDTRAAARLQLRRAGVPAHHIDVSDRCTFRDAEAFFSHRRDGALGRMAAAIAMPAV